MEKSRANAKEINKHKEQARTSVLEEKDIKAIARMCLVIEQKKNIKEGMRNNVHKE